MPGEPATPKRRSRWRRLLRLMAALVLLGMIALPLGIWLAYANRVTLTNRALALLEPYDITLSALEIRRSGRLDATGLVIKDRQTQREMLRVPSLAVQPGWRELTSGNIGEIILDEPQLELEESQVRRWLQTSETLAEEEPLPPASRPFSVGKLAIHDANLRLRLDDQSVIELALNYQAEQVIRTADGRLNSGPQQLVIERGRFESSSKQSPLSLQRFEANGRLKDGVLELEQVELTDPVLHLTPALAGLLRPAPATVAEQPPAPPDQAGSTQEPPSLFKGVNIASLRIHAWQLDAQDFKAGNGSGFFLPDTQAAMDYEASELSWQSDGKVTMGAQRLELTNVDMHVPGGQGHIRIPRMEAVLEPGQDLQQWAFKKLRIAKPDIHWTKALRESFSPPSPDAPATSEETPAESAPPQTPATKWQVAVESGGIESAQLHLADDALMDFQLNTGLQLEVKTLRFGSEGWSSTEPQTLKVSEGTLQFPGDDKQPPRKPFFELPAGELAMIPDRWNGSYHVQRLALQRPLLRLRDGNTPWLQKPTAQPSQQPAPPAAAATDETETPWWQRLNFDELTLTDGVSDLLVHAIEPIEARGQISITTLPHERGRAHRLRLEGFEARLPTLSRLPFPVANARLFESVVRLPELWSTRRMESLKLDGVNFEAGEALVGLLESQEKAAASEPAAETPAPAPSPALRGRPWQVGELDVTNSSVTVANLVPGLPAVKFNLEYHAKDTPLLAEDLARNLAPQRMELANLTIPSPYEPLRPVAELDSVFVHFTLQGLMNKKLEKIEIVSPTLFVGEDLFWYVDYYRKYVSKEALSPANGSEMVADDRQFALKAASALLEDEPAPAEAAWSIERLQVHSGKLILAPKGKPLKGFGKPLPFNINTEVVRGTLEAQLDIPSDVYTLDDYKLELDGMSGHVRFNLPIRQKDNNLVETFEVDRIRWKELQTGKAFLSITYDAAGIYAKFGAEAYEGYINGELNVYNDDSYTWDGWIGGKKVQTHELTQKLFPTYLFMQGNVDATLVAQGNMHELFQADGSFKNDTPGRFSITALNDAVEKLPGDWTQLEKQLTQIGVETLRDFEYEHAEAKFRLYGREGTGDVRFTGPHGSRNFDINVFDHRWTTDDKPLTTAE